LAQPFLLVLLLLLLLVVAVEAEVQQQHALAAMGHGPPKTPAQTQMWACATV
jgi:hypothetical protein